MNYLKIFIWQVSKHVTLLSSIAWLNQHDGSPVVDASQYLSLTGSLQCLSISRPDVAYPINKLAQHMYALKLTRQLLSVSYATSNTH